MALTPVQRAATTTPSDGYFYIERAMYSGGYLSYYHRAWVGANYPSTSWSLEEGFDSVADAVDCISEIRQSNRRVRPMRVVCDGYVVWTEQYGEQSTPQEEQVDNQLAAPLHIARQDLIDALQVNLDKEQAARAAAQAALAAREQAATDAVATLDPDELLNLVRKHIQGDLEAIVEMVKEAKESGRLKAKEVLPNDKESALVRTVRVLTLANDETIEVKNTDAIYPLL